MKRTIGNKLNDYKHLKPPGSEFLPRLVMIRRASNVVFKRNRLAWLNLKILFQQRMEKSIRKPSRNGQNQKLFKKLQAGAKVLCQKGWC